ncbi:MAG: hypothetical protein ACK5HL_03400 [Bacilli bacterium]
MLEIIIIIIFSIFALFFLSTIIGLLIEKKAKKNGTFNQLVNETHKKNEKKEKKGKRKKGLFNRKSKQELMQEQIDSMKNRTKSQNIEGQPIVEESVQKENLLEKFPFNFDNLNTVDTFYINKNPYIENQNLKNEIKPTIDFSNFNANKKRKRKFKNNVILNPLDNLNISKVNSQDYIESNYEDDFENNVLTNTIISDTLFDLDLGKYINEDDYTGLFDEVENETKDAINKFKKSVNIGDSKVIFEEIEHEN